MIINNKTIISYYLNYDYNSILFILKNTYKSEIIINKIPINLLSYGVPQKCSILTIQKIQNTIKNNNRTKNYMIKFKIFKINRNIQ